MFKKKYITKIVPFLLLITSCATSYQPIGYTGGYSEYPVSSTIYMISFYGNGFTNKETVHKYLLLRAAEFSYNQGKTHFYSVPAGEDVAISTMQFGGNKTTITQTGPNQLTARTRNPVTIPVAKYTQSIKILPLNWNEIDPKDRQHLISNESIFKMMNYDPLKKQFKN